MKRPPRQLVAMVSLPFLVGCTTTLARPLPEPDARAATNIRGVVLSANSEQVEYSRTDLVEWNEESVAISGTLRDSGGVPSSRTFLYSDLDSVLVRETDVNRTSFLIAGVMVGIMALGATLFTGFTTDRTLLPGS